jgi:hypothetical protein
MIYFHQICRYYRRICTVFVKFSFLEWSLDVEEPAGPVLRTEDEFAFDVNAVPEPVPAEDNED